MKFKRIILIALLLLAIFTISTVSANSNASDTISTEQDNDELKNIEVESRNVGKYAENETDEEFSSNLIGQSEDNLLSKNFNIIVIGNTATIEKGEIAEFTIDSGKSDSGEINIDIIDFKGKTCFNFPNYYVSDTERNLNIDTSNLIAGEDMHESNFITSVLTIGSIIVIIFFFFLKECQTIFLYILL